MAYTDRCKVLRPRPGARSGGVFVAGEAEVLYDGPCDIQDRPQDLKLVQDAGMPVPKYDVRIFFPPDVTGDVLFDGGARHAQQQDLVEVRPRRGPVRRGRIEAIRSLDDSILVRWVRT